MEQKLKDVPKAQEKKVDANKSLMKHTKAQLIDIIFRKDDRERELLNTNKKLVVEAGDFKTIINKKDETIELLNNEISRKNDAMRKLVFENNNLKSDYEKVCDERATETAEYKNKIRMYNLALYIFGAITILALIFRYIGI